MVRIDPAVTEKLILDLIQLYLKVKCLRKRQKTKKKINMKLPPGVMLLLTRRLTD